MKCYEGKLIKIAYYIWSLMVISRYELDIFFLLFSCFSLGQFNLVLNSSKFGTHRPVLFRYL